ncbi:DUF4019 domain-containing protein [Agarivorans sp. Alg241-V36]|uniref:DUF4019 domain-containing protein n=1 Tax=Agarivorans sp. Alg241-V36 TaxID=2305992 RepID=UPI0013CF4CCC|nr:DUF4019 domain-containing protein [Agarivorans sp. Alg241-V36]
MRITPDLKLKALEVALSWLHLIDLSHYAKAYSISAPYFRSQITLGELSKRIIKVNQQIGETTNRTLKSTHHICKVPNAPVGDYVIIEFELETELQPNVIETITPVFEDGQWKICGYYLSVR